MAISTTVFNFIFVSVSSFNEICFSSDFDDLCDDDDL